MGIRGSSPCSMRCKHMHTCVDMTDDVMLQSGAHVGKYMYSLRGMYRGTCREARRVLMTALWNDSAVVPAAVCCTPLD